MTVTTIPTKHTVHELVRKLGPVVESATDEELAGLRDALEDMYQARQRGKPAAPAKEDPSTYEITNPSDMAFLDAHDFATACCACLMLGKGAYGLTEIHRTGMQSRMLRGMPIFLFGGAQEFFMREFKADLETVLERVKRGIPDVLDTVRLAGERTSLTDIVARAKDVAAALRERFEREEARG